MPKLTELQQGLIDQAILQGLKAIHEALHAESEPKIRALLMAQAIARVAVVYLMDVSKDFAAAANIWDFMRNETEEGLALCFTRILVEGGSLSASPHDHIKAASSKLN